MDDVTQLHIILQLLQLIGMLVGGAVALIATVRYLKEIRDAIQDLAKRMGGVEQRVSRLEGIATRDNQ